MTAACDDVLCDESTRVLITGASGFVGRQLIASLLSSETSTGCGRVHVFAGVHGSVTADSLKARIGRDGAMADSGLAAMTVVPLDILNASDVAATIHGRIRPHHVYHLAARASGADTDRAGIFAVNVHGTRHVLDAVAHLRDSARALLVSTGYVYGETDPARPAREEDPVAPRGLYGVYAESKLEMEAIARQYHRVSIVARAFAHTGPGQEPRFAVPAFARQLALIEAEQLPGDLFVGNVESQRDIMDVRDVVRAYQALMQYGAVGNTYNVALGRPIAMRDVLDRLRSMIPITTRLLLDPSRLRATDIACSTGDSTRIRALTGWRATTPLNKTLSDLLEYWRHEVTDRVAP